MSNNTDPIKFGVAEANSYVYDGEHYAKVAVLANTENIKQAHPLEFSHAEVNSYVAVDSSDLNITPAIENQKLYAKVVYIPGLSATLSNNLTEKADLVDGKVPSSQLPSYIDDVVEYDNINQFPAEGEIGKIYLIIGDNENKNNQYRWSGTQYTIITSQSIIQLQQQVNTLNTTVSTKANISDLADVAISSSYNDLTDKPYVINDLTWEDIQNIVRQGKAEDYFEIGDILNVTHATLGKIGFQIVSFDTATPNDASRTHSMTLLADKPIYSLAFDAREPSNTDNNIVLCGYNNWEKSNIRQWLNSDIESNSWFTPTHEYDVAPNYINQAGFLYGLPVDFLSAIGEVKNTTALNRITDGGGSIETIDKFYLPSQTEIFGTKTNNIDEGEQFTSFIGLGDVDRIKYYNNSPYYWWMRSPIVGSSYYVYRVITTGILGCNDACNGYGVVPACVIC